MKKLLLIGAMLVVGATSFSAVSFDLTETPGQSQNPSTYSGTGALPIESRGKIVDSTGKVILVLNAINGSQTDATKMIFDFGAVGRGQVEQLINRFEAQVLEDDNPKDLSGATISVKLEKENNAADFQNFTIMDTIQPTKKLVDISYELTKDAGLTPDNKTYNGSVRASAYRPTIVEDAKKEYTIGEFVDNTVSLVFNISGVTR